MNDLSKYVGDLKLYELRLYEANSKKFGPEKSVIKYIFAKTFEKENFVTNHTILKSKSLDEFCDFEQSIFGFYKKLVKIHCVENYNTYSEANWHNLGYSMQVNPVNTFHGFIYEAIYPSSNIELKEDNLNKVINE